VIAAANARIDALQTVEANDIQAFILRIGRDGDGRGVALADDLNGLAFLNANFGKSLPAHARNATARIVRPGVRDLKAYTLPILCHCCVPIVRAF
jgi:hypothetical protein